MSVVFGAVDELLQGHLALVRVVLSHCCLDGLKRDEACLHQQVVLEPRLHEERSRGGKQLTRAAVDPRYKFCQLGRSLLEDLNGDR